MKNKLIFFCSALIVAGISIIWAGCIVEKPNPCDCAFNETYQNTTHWDQKLSDKCFRFAESLNNTDRNVWESEKQNCLKAGGK